MTDNEIIFCFQKGCALLNNDDVQNSDLKKIKDALIECSRTMLPTIHKYSDGKTCENCGYKNKNGYCKVESYSECRDTIDRPFFVEKRK